MSSTGKVCLLFLLALTLCHAEAAHDVMNKKELTAEVKSIEKQLANLTTCKCDSLGSEVQAVKGSLTKLQTDLQTARQDLAAVKRNADEVANVKTDVTTLRGELNAVKRNADEVANVKTDVTTLRRELNAVKRNADEVAGLKTDLQAVRVELSDVRRRADHMLSEMRCESWNWKYATCSAPSGMTVTTALVKVLDSGPNGPCNAGSTFGILNAGRSLWVSNGCRASFLVFGLRV